MAVKFSTRSAACRQSLVGAVCGGAAIWAGAQGLPTTLQVSATLAAPSGMTGYPMAINSAGQVGGFALKSAGKVLKLGSSNNGFYTSYYWYWDPQVYVYPVVWTNGSPSLPTRYKSTYNTTIVREAATGGWEALSNNSAAKLSTSALNIEAGATYGAMVSLQLSNGVYTPIQPSGAAFSQPPLINRKGTMAGIANAVQTAGLDLLVVKDGQTIRVPTPSGVFDWAVVGISDDDQVLVAADRDEAFTMVDGSPVYTQYHWQQRCFVWRAGGLTEVVVPTPAPAISVRCGGISPNGLVAAYVSYASGGPLRPYGLTTAMFTWRNGQLDRFQTDFKVFASDYLPRIRLTDAGWGVYDAALDGSIPSSADPWVFFNGQHQRLTPMVRPALASGEQLVVKSVNAGGQLLATVMPASASGTVRQVVLSPR